MDGPLFSVLMANYNNGKYIQDAINSVLSQTYANFELVIVDDASTDDSLEIIKPYIISDSRISCHKNQTNLMCGATKRATVSYAKGDILGFLDPDDTLLPHAIEVMVAAHLENPESSLIHSSHFICDEHLIVKREAYGACEIPKGESYLSYGIGVTAFATFKKKFYERTLGIDATFKRAVDQDLYYKLEEVGTIKFINKPLYHYRQNSGGISSFNNLSKSRYWFVRAKQNAFWRRNAGISNAKNINQKEINAWRGILYISKSSDAFRKWNLCRGFYWLIRSVIASPHDKYFALKVKSLFNGSVFHFMYKKITQ